MDTVIQRGDLWVVRHVYHAVLPDTHKNEQWEESLTACHIQSHHMYLPRLCIQCQRDVHGHFRVDTNQLFFDTLRTNEQPHINNMTASFLSRDFEHDLHVNIKHKPLPQF